jgi:hypothetical protein
VPLPDLPKKEKINFTKAVQQKLLYFGEFDPTVERDIELKFIKDDSKLGEWYG